MKPEVQSEYATRDSVLKLLSDEENGRVSMAETAPSLGEGEEYLDLEHLDRGVLRADGAATPMGRLLPKKAVQGDTWSKVLAHLKSSGKRLQKRS